MRVEVIIAPPPSAPFLLALSQTHFIHDRQGNVIAETDGTGPAGTVREYIYLPETEIAPTAGSRTVVDRPIAVVNAVNTSPVLWQVHVDHLNRPIRMTDSGKASVWDAVWSPWGSAWSLSGTATLDARFPGQWYQLESGLHYNWHRHYDPSLGRYTQPDSLGFVDGPSVYGYAGGSPLRLADKDGKSLGKEPPPASTPVIEPPFPGNREFKKRSCSNACKQSAEFQCQRGGGAFYLYFIWKKIEQRCIHDYYWGCYNNCMNEARQCR